MIEAIAFVFGEDLPDPKNPHNEHLFYDYNIRCVVSLKFEMPDGSTKRFTRIGLKTTYTYMIFNKYVTEEEYLLELGKMNFRFAGQNISVYNKTTLKVTRKSAEELGAFFDIVSNSIEFKPEYDELKAKLNFAESTVLRWAKMIDSIELEKEKFITLTLYKLYLCDKEIQETKEKFVAEQLKVNAKNAKMPLRISRYSEAIPKQTPSPNFKNNAIVVRPKTHNHYDNLITVDKLNSYLNEKVTERRELLQFAVNHPNMNIRFSEEGPNIYAREIDYTELPEYYKKESDDIIATSYKRSMLEKEIKKIRQCWLDENNIKDDANIDNINMRIKEATTKHTLALNIESEARLNWEKLRVMRSARFNNFMAPLQTSLSRIYAEIAQDEDSLAFLRPLDEEEPYLAIDAFVKERHSEHISTRTFHGGSRMIVDLALIFAIHEWKPSPLVVIDDIDRNLYHEASKKIEPYLSRQKQTQFIVTTKEDSYFTEVTKTITLEN